MLSNAYFLAKFRFDTAENEPAKNLQNIAKFQNFQLDNLVDFEKCCNSNKKKGPALFEKTDSLVLGARGST